MFIYNFQKKYVMKKIMILAFCAFLGTNTYAQREQTVFSNAGLRVSGFWGGYNHGIGQFNNDYSGFDGGFWAVEFSKVMSVGGNHYRLNAMPLAGGRNYTLNANQLQLGFTPKAWHTIHPIFGVAGGVGKLQISNEAGFDKVYVAQPSAGIEVNVFRWLHVDLQGGYRFVMDSDVVGGVTDKDFSGGYAQLGLKFGYSWGRTPKKKRGSDDD